MYLVPKIISTAFLPKGYFEYWAVGDKNTVLKSQDYGVTWNSTDIGGNETYDYEKILFSTYDDAWILVNNSRRYHEF